MSPNTRVDQESLLTYACAFADHGDASRDILEVLLELGADPNLLYWGAGGPLWHAVVANDLEAVELLLQRGANPNLVHYYPETPETALDTAFGEDHLAHYYLDDTRVKLGEQGWVRAELEARLVEYERCVATVPKIIAALERAGGRTYWELSESGQITADLLPKKPNAWQRR